MRNPAEKNYWQLVWKRFNRNRSSRWSFRIFVLLLWIAVLNPFIAGDVPIYAKIEGESSFPVLKKYAIDLGLVKRSGHFVNEGSWQDLQYEAIIRPLIPYSATYRDIRNIHFKSPLGPQNLKKGQSWHYLGTDGLGRDIAAGMIAGVVVALKVGLFSMLIASFIGIFLGGLAGFFGDDQMRISVVSLGWNLIALFLAIHFVFVSRSFYWAEGMIVREIGIGTCIVIFLFLICNFLSKQMNRFAVFQKKITVPLDLLIMRLVEVLNSIPGLLIIIAFAAIFSSRSLIPIIVIIGLVSWTGITRFVRAELLKIRNLEYIQAAKVLGFSKWRILFIHALPNSLGPALIVIAFGIAGAILAEATLAFLGIGTDLSRVSWGTLLQGAKDNAANWWMAFFPGLAIFLTVMIFNLIGQGLKDALDSKDL